MIKICEYCKNKYQANFKTQRFCSLKCSSSRGLTPKKGFYKKCIICKKEFYVKASHNNQMCCSIKCASKIISIKNKGQIRSKEFREKMSILAKKRIGNKNSCWRGGKTGGNGGYIYIYSYNEAYC